MKRNITKKKEGGDGEWGSGCVVLGCWLGWNHDSWAKVFTPWLNYLGHLSHLKYIRDTAFVLNLKAWVSHVDGEGKNNCSVQGTTKPEMEGFRIHVLRDAIQAIPWSAVLSCQMWHLASLTKCCGHNCHDRNLKLFFSFSGRRAFGCESGNAWYS